jgi:hypothetical protein
MASQRQGECPERAERVEGHPNLRSRLPTKRELRLASQTRRSFFVHTLCLSLLTDFLLDLFESGTGPSSDRGLVAAFSAGSVALAAVSVWLLATFPDPIREPVWGLAVLAGSVACGAAGSLVSLLHLRRNEDDRPFAVVSLTLNATAVTIPIAWMLTAPA